MYLSTVSLLSRQCRFLVIERLGSRYPSLSLYPVHPWRVAHPLPLPTPYHIGLPMPATPGQGTRRYMKLRAIFLDECKEANAPCWLCGQPIDYRIPHNDPVTGAVNREAFELDHAYPRSTHPELAEDPSNFRPSHRACNLKRSDGKGDLPMGSVSSRFLITPDESYTYEFN
nr:MAG TPA: restriction endonuclease [Caudoviricetes sp.]